MIVTQTWCKEISFGSKRQVVIQLFNVTNELQSSLPESRTTSSRGENSMTRSPSEV